MHSTHSTMLRLNRSLDFLIFILKEIYSLKCLLMSLMNDLVMRRLFTFIWLKLQVSCAIFCKIGTFYCSCNSMASSVVASLQPISSSPSGQFSDPLQTCEISFIIPMRPNDKITSHHPASNASPPCPSDPIPVIDGDFGTEEIVSLANKGAVCMINQGCQTEGTNL